MNVRERECEVAGLDQKEVNRIARGIEKYARQAESMGLVIFGGGSGTGTLRWSDPYDGNFRALIVAEFSHGVFDGGDASAMEDDDGLLRGE